MTPRLPSRLEPSKWSSTIDHVARVDTRVLQVIYELDTTDKPIYVGQQVDVFIDVGAQPTALSGSKSAAE
jgi:HlyD family secretion protein